MGVLSRWRSRLATRRSLLKRAEASVRYWARRAGSARGRQMLEEAVARRTLRRWQVAEAKRVVDRHAVQHLSDRGAALIAGFEGFRAAPYRDAVGVWTVGFGSTKGVGPNTPHVTRAQALDRMRREIADTYEPPVRALGVPLTQGQFDALVSFVYNVGPNGIAPITGIGKALRQRRYRDAAGELLEWNRAGGRVLPGLTSRRRAERAMFLR